MTPKISVIIPLYNVEKYLKDSIESVLNQEMTDFELILVDDGSTDGSSQICDEYAKKDKRIIVIHKENGGLSSARNAGIEAAKSEYLQFLDGDDTLETNTLAELHKLKEKTKADIIIFGVVSYNIENKKTVSVKIPEHSEMKLLSNYEIMKNISILFEYSLWNFSVDKLYKREILIKNNLRFDPYFNIRQDAMFLMELLPCVSSIYVTEKHYYNYYIRDNQSVVKKFKPELFDKLHLVLLKIKKTVDNYENNSNNSEMLYKKYIDSILWSYEQLFYKDCDYGFFQRYRYIKETFSIDKLPKEFKNKTIEFFNKTDYFDADYSKTSRIIAKLIIRRRYLLAWKFHLINKALNREGKNCQKSV